MQNSLRVTWATFGLLFTLSGLAAASDLVVPAGQTMVYDTSAGPLVVDNLRIEEGATLEVVGAKAFVLHVRGALDIEGDLDLSGGDAKDVATLHTANLPERGASGEAGGGAGGVASVATTTSTPMGGSGSGGFGLAGLGGGGGESGFAATIHGTNGGGGGGGGALAGDLLTQVWPGIIAQDGTASGMHLTGAVSGQHPAMGGMRGASVFVDGNPRNDFWGRKRNASTGTVTMGELAQPVPGRGGGAGGDAIASAVFPPPAWTPSTDAKGCAGGGGGGLGLIDARLVRIGPMGHVRADGGKGGRGETDFGLSAVAGCSGGGSGGYLVIQAQRFDLRRAGLDSLSARGGLGGYDFHGPYWPGAGGDGGAGVIQLHVKNPSDLLLPLGKSVADLTLPDAHVLLPIL
jgi:hypothetical protein